MSDEDEEDGMNTIGTPEGATSLKPCSKDVENTVLKLATKIFNGCEQVRIFDDDDVMLMVVVVVVVGVVVMMKMGMVVLYDEHDAYDDNERSKKYDDDDVGDGGSSSRSTCSQWLLNQR